MVARCSGRSRAHHYNMSKSTSTSIRELHRILVQMRQLICAEILDLLDREGIDPRETTFMGKMEEELQASGDSMSLAAGRVWVQDPVH